MPAYLINKGADGTFSIEKVPAGKYDLSYSGGKLIGLNVRGQRRGYDLDAHWKQGGLSFDSEWLGFDFPPIGERMARAQ